MTTGELRRSPGFEFEVVARDRATAARAGLFHTPHGTVATPVFMPVGTQASVKAVSPAELRGAGAQIVLANAYHLSLRPGAEVVEQLGGLHEFMGWEGPILTDSGGFQVFSLARRASPGFPSAPASGSAGLVAVDDVGVTFRSHLDGAERRFTPEGAVEIQEALGADVIMALDECSRSGASYDDARLGMERTHRWAERCRDRWGHIERLKRGRAPQALFGIVQGGPFRDLRRASTDFIAGLGLPGVAIGGESIGFSKPLTRQILDWVVDLLPEDRPRYAMGLGAPEDYLAVVERGVDMFDSVLPTRIARNGTLLTSRGRLRVVNAEYAADGLPVEPGCDCYTCARFSRAYLRHLFKAEALLAYRLATLHNLRFCLRLVAEIRQALLRGDLADLRAKLGERQRGGE